MEMGWENNKCAYLLICFKIDNNFHMTPLAQTNFVFTIAPWARRYRINPKWEEISKIYELFHFGRPRAFHSKSHGRKVLRKDNLMIAEICAQQGAPGGGGGGASKQILVHLASVRHINLLVKNYNILILTFWVIMITTGVCICGRH